MRLHNFFILSARHSYTRVRTVITDKAIRSESSIFSRRHRDCLLLLLIIKSYVIEFGVRSNNIKLIWASVLENPIYAHCRIGWAVGSMSSSRADTR